MQQSHTVALTDWSDEKDHHLYAKPLVSRCVKGQLFNKATGLSQHAGPVFSWETRLHPGTLTQPDGDIKMEIHAE